MSERKSTEEAVAISKHGFYFETPLYENMEPSQLERMLFTGDVDAYSAKNQSDTTYGISSKAIDTIYFQYPSDSNRTEIGFYLVTLQCKRKNDDTLRFVVYKDKEVIFKIGQYPSLADLQFAEIGKKYGKVLPEEDLKNLKKAIGLASHGAGAGSFVYLRRIFERLILEAYINNAIAVAIPEDIFKKQRMLDKVETLKAFLPSQLVEMKSIYSILGNGVHELTEEECLRYFVPIKLSIELILDQKIEGASKHQRDATVKKQLQEIQQEIAKDKISDEHED